MPLPITDASAAIRRGLQAFKLPSHNRVGFADAHKAHSAFTLSETLISLVVIGIVAALTVPAVNQFFKKQEASERLKKFWSTMKQAEMKAKADGNDWAEWAETASSTSDSTLETVQNFENRYLLPYIIYNKHGLSSQNRNITFFSDGSYFTLGKGECLHFIFDLNGDKKPNTNGKDRFHYLVCPDAARGYAGTGSFMSYRNASTNTREKALENCQNNTAQCSVLLQFDSWEFKDDYPYRL